MCRMDGIGMLHRSGTHHRAGPVSVPNAHLSVFAGAPEGAVPAWPWLDSADVRKRSRADRPTAETGAALN